MLGVCGLGIALGTAMFWIVEARREARVEQVMGQSSFSAEPSRRSVNVTAAPPAALDGIPPYPRAVPRRVAEGMRGQGSQMAVAWFATDDAIEDVIAFYEAAFSKQKLLFVSHRYNARSGYVGWLEPDRNSSMADAGLLMLDGVMHLISVLKERNQTVVLLSASRPLQILDGVAALPPGVVLPPWAENPKVFDLGEGKLSQTTLFTQVHEHKAAEVDTWMRDSLKQQGWSIADQAEAPARLSLDFKRQQERLSVVITPRGQRIDLMVQYANQPQSLTEGFQ